MSAYYFFILFCLIYFLQYFCFWFYLMSFQCLLLFNFIPNVVLNIVVFIFLNFISISAGAFVSSSISVSILFTNCVSSFMLILSILSCFFIYRFILSSFFCSSDNCSNNFSYRFSIFVKLDIFLYVVNKKE